MFVIANRSKKNHVLHSYEEVLVLRVDGRFSDSHGNPMTFETRKIAAEYLEKFADKNWRLEYDTDFISKCVIMRTDNTPIHKFEYRGYKVAIIEGAGYVPGDSYCWEYKSERSRCFSGAGDNPCDFEEMILFAKKQLDKYPECIWTKPYDRNNKSTVINLTQDIETKRRFIINDFEKHFFMECEGVKWVINFPHECLDMKGYSSLRYYPRIIQHKGFEIWFEFNVEYHPKDKEYTLKILQDIFSKLECKPIFNDGNMWWQHFDLNHNSYFTDEYELHIREDHPRHGNKYVKFYINPDYTDPGKIHEDEDIKIFI